MSANTNKYPAQDLFWFRVQDIAKRRSRQAKTVGSSRARRAGFLESVSLNARTPQPERAHGVPDDETEIDIDPPLPLIMADLEQTLTLHGHAAMLQSITGHGHCVRRVRAACRFVFGSLTASVRQYGQGMVSTTSRSNHIRRVDSQSCSTHNSLTSPPTTHRCCHS